MQAQIDVEGMTCGGCANGIRAALEQMQGVRRAEVSLAAKSARVDYDESQTSPVEIIAAITELGYRAKQQA